MRIVQDLWRQPRQSSVRRAAFQVHLWAGLILGLYMAVMSGTGVALLFVDEIEEALYPEQYRATSAGGQLATVTALRSSAAAAYPDRTVTALYAPSHARQTVMVYLKKGDDVLYAYLDPVTARVLADATTSSSVVRWLREFHFNLFAGRTGRSVNGVGGVALFVLSVTGVIVWWPGVANSLRGLSFRFTVNWKRLCWELHSTVGIWIAAALAMWALTGFYFGHATLVQSAIHRLSPLSQIEPPVSTPIHTASSLDVHSLVQEAARRSPRAHFYGLQMPANPRAPYIVFMSRIRDGEKRHCDYHYFDQYSGASLGVWRRGVPASFGDAVIASMVPLHFGSFGGIGIKLLWAALGLTPLALFLTSVAIWWNRVASPRLRSVGTSDERQCDSCGQNPLACTSTRAPGRASQKDHRLRN